MYVTLQRQLMGSYRYKGRFCQNSPVQLKNKIHFTVQDIKNNTNISIVVIPLRTEITKKI